MGWEQWLEFKSLKRVLHTYIYIMLEWNFYLRLKKIIKNTKQIIAKTKLFLHGWFFKPSKTYD